MERLSATLRQSKCSDGSTRVLHWCPGCDEAHQFIVAGDKSRMPVWDFDQNVERPTVSPSVRHDLGDRGTCHYFIKAGRIEYCGDSFHALAGQAVDLPVFPEDW